MGEVPVPDDRLWGAQTQRSFENFRIGSEKMPLELINALVLLKKACARANREAGKLDEARAAAISAACGAVLAGGYETEFPLAVWQTGSGTQTNMNVNEVIAHLAGQSGLTLHPNDHVNMSQSSNDVFPSAIHVAAALALRGGLFPALSALRDTLLRLESETADIVKVGRTHLQDATPLRFSQEVSGWRAMLEANRTMLDDALGHLLKLAIGGTAVGTGLNAPAGFDKAVCAALSDDTGLPFLPDGNKFHALTSKDAVVFAHGALKALAANLMKIANDVRWLASGPRCGLGEIVIPENEPGSSIMPGKVNPTQCEAVTMVAVQVMGNDAAIGFAASQGNFELNVFMPVIAYDFLQSVRLLADVTASFNRNCAAGIGVRREKAAENLERSLMLVTKLTPVIGYEAAARIAHEAHRKGLTLRAAAIDSGLLGEAELDRLLDPTKMV
jgi:fumarate hydratase class II